MRRDEIEMQNIFKIRDETRSRFIKSKMPMYNGQLYRFRLGLFETVGSVLGSQKILNLGSQFEPGSNHQNLETDSRKTLFKLLFARIFT